MERTLMAILACRICKGHLQLKVSGEEQREVVAGQLHSQKCSQRYSIEEGIRNLLTAELGG